METCYAFKGQSLKNGLSCTLQEEHSFMKDAEPARQSPDNRAQGLALKE